MNYQSSEIIRLSLKSTNTIHDAIKILDKEKKYFFQNYRFKEINTFCSRKNKNFE